MAKVFIEETTLTAIGDAIRGKTGKTELIDPANMGAEIESIDSISYDESKIIEASATGTGMLRLDDVSEIPHDIELQVSGENVDLSTVKITEQGTNLLDIDGREIVSFGAAANTTQRSFTGNGIIKGFAYNNYYSPSKVLTFEKYKNGFNCSIEVNQLPYGIGFDFKSAPNITYVARYDGVESISKSTIFLTEYDAEGNFLREKTSPTIIKGAKCYTTGADTAWVVISFQCTKAETVIEFNNVFIGIDTYMGFEPYKEPIEYPVSADGIVQGIKSISPTMVFASNVPEAQITANYHKSWGMQTEYDRFWDVYQDNGNRTVYTYGFYGSGWTNETFKPKYPIKVVGSAANMFDSSKLTQFDFVERGIELDVSEATNITYLFRECAGIIRVGTIDCASCKNLNRLFYGCGVVTIDNLIVNENTTYDNLFQYTRQLVNLTISGTIAQNGFEARYCTKLSKASIENIISCLSATTSDMSITLSQTAVDTAFETEEGLADGSTSTEWATLIATKSNWTISLL